MALRIVWTREHIQQLLLSPERLVHEEPFRSWVAGHGGLPQLYAELRALPLKPNQRKVLALLIDQPGESSTIYADQLSVHLATYYRHQRALLDALVAFLNSGAIDDQSLPLFGAAPAAAAAQEAARAPRTAGADAVEPPHDGSAGAGWMFGLTEAADTGSAAPSGKAQQRRRMSGLRLGLLAAALGAALGFGVVLPAAQACRSRLVVTDQRRIDAPFATVYAAAPNPALQNTWLVSTFEGQIFRSLDSGATWTEATIVDSQAVIKGFVFDPVNASLIYAYGESGVYKTIDNGKNWLPITPGFERTIVNGLALDANDRSVLYMATWERGVFRSGDGGASWQDWNEGLADQQLYAVVIDRAGAVYVGTYGRGAWRRGKGQAGWQPTGLDKGEVRGLAAGPALLANVWGEGVFASEDGGAAWHALNDGLIDLTLRSNIAQRAGGYPLYVGGWSGGLFFKPGADAAWARLEPGVRVIRTITPLPGDPRTLVVGALDGVFVYRTDAPPWFECLP